MKLDGRVAVITGGSRGFGLALAEAFVAEGADVLICARDTDRLGEACASLAARTRPGRRAVAVTADVSRPEDSARVIDTAISDFGRVDVLVNNAGVYGPMGAIEDVDWLDWARAVEINLMGTVLPCREVLPHMKRTGSGKIINLSGGGATAPLPRISAYAASKAAVVRFTETLAHEVREDRIDVNAVAPGALNTRLLDQVIEAGADKVGAEFYQRSLQQQAEGGAPLEKGAALCVFLASRESDGVSGRLLSALWDPWPTLPDHADTLQQSDIYTLRRIVPKDRGEGWG
jgi:NAD(P)-dependent dehydrogenase (short-subunit alcohol dehydrogenase family)